MGNFNSIYPNSVLSKKFEELAVKFEQYILANPCKLDFREQHIEQTACGTVACHGGYGAIVLARSDLKFSTDHNNDTVAKYATGVIVTYTVGADLIADYLGFRDRRHLKNWAEENPLLWGNQGGSEMFTGFGYYAFGFKKEDEMSLADIAAHYRKVSINLKRGKWYFWYKRFINKLKSL